MGKPKYIYLTDELHKKVSQEDNASSLISVLLNQHYLKQEEINLTPVQKDVKIAQDIEERKKELELLQEEHDKILQEQEKIKLQELEAKSEHEKTRALKDKWADEVRNIPFDDRPKFEEWRLKNA